MSGYTDAQERDAGAALALDGRLRLDEAACASAADDFGHLVHRTPAVVVEPASAPDIAAAIHWAARHGMRFAARGRGHSTFGRSQAEDGIVAEMSQLRGVGPVEEDRVTVEAGATWSEVLDVTLARGKTPPVLTDYLELSVGGTLAVGGVGATTSTFGVQSDNVIELEVVTGDGARVKCSPTENPDLFDAVRAGLGQVAVITRATLALVEAPAFVRRFELFYSDLGALLDDQRFLTGEGRVDAVQGAVVATPGGDLAFRLEAAKFFAGEPPNDYVLLAGVSDDPDRREAQTVAYREYLERLSPLEAALRAEGRWDFPHPWLTTFVGDSHVEPVVAAELAALDPAADLGPLGQIVISPIRAAAVQSPLLQLPSEELCFTFNLIRLPDTDDAVETDRLLTANRAVYERVRSAGGSLYPVSALAMSPNDWRDHFGPDLRRLEAAKARFDPGRVLTPGYEIF